MFLIFLLFFDLIFHFFLNRSISLYLNVVVGFFMIGLGLYGIVSAVYDRYYAKTGFTSINSDTFTESDSLLKNEDSSDLSLFVQNNVSIDADDTLDTPSSSSQLFCCNLSTGKFKLLFFIIYFF